jgi:Muskelin N-terminus
MKEFRACVGMTKDHMTEVLSSTLKDDSVPETFSLRHTNSAGVPFPSRYLKIIPVSCVDIHPRAKEISIAGILGFSAHIATAFTYLSGSCLFLGSTVRALCRR